MPEDFSGCENFRNLVLFIFSLQLVVSCNPPFGDPEFKFSNLLSQAINGH